MACLRVSDWNRRVHSSSACTQTGFCFQLGIPGWEGGRGGGGANVYVNERPAEIPNSPAAEKVTSVVTFPSRLWPTPRWWSKWSRTLVQWYWTSWLSWRPPWLQMSLRRHWRFGPLEEHSVNITIHLRLSLSLFLNVPWKLKGRVCPCLAFLLFLFSFFPIWAAIKIEERRMLGERYTP